MIVIGMIVLSFFALIGFAAFHSALINSRDTDAETALVLENLIAQNAEMRVRRAVRICERIRCNRLICRCADEGAERICERLMKEYRMIEIG